MSTRYVKNRLSFVSSLATDYSRPTIQEVWELTSSGTQTPYESISCATTGTTIVTPATILWLAIFNEDTTNYVSVAWTNNGTANVQRLDYNGTGQNWMYVPGATAANIVITAHTQACVCRVFFGAA